MGRYRVIRTRLWSKHYPIASCFVVDLKLDTTKRTVNSLLAVSSGRRSSSDRMARSWSLRGGGGVGKDEVGRFRSVCGEGTPGAPADWWPYVLRCMTSASTDISASKVLQLSQFGTFRSWHESWTGPKMRNDLFCTRIFRDLQVEKSTSLGNLEVSDRAWRID